MMKSVVEELTPIDAAASVWDPKTVVSIRKFGNMNALQGQIIPERGVVIVT